MELTPDLLLRAYAIGIFPMAESRNDHDLHWIDPEQRGILPLEKFHISRKLKRKIRRCPFEVRCDADFNQTLMACAEATRSRPDTWINPVIEKLYSNLFEMGFAHSVECWRDGRLVGGLYGVSLGAAFFGESMFSRETDASKIALVHLIFRLKKGGFRLLDTQFRTPHLEQFGVVEIARQDYRRRLSMAISAAAEFPKGKIRPAEMDAFLREST